MSDEIRAALAGRDMGILVRAYRHHSSHGRPVPQATVAAWLGVTQGQLSRIETGQNQVRDLDKLIHYARRLRIPGHLLWFDVPASHHSATTSIAGGIRLRGGAVISTGVRNNRELARSLAATLDQYVTTDNLAGPLSLVDVVSRQAAFIERQLRGVHGDCRGDLLRVAARYAEFAGWLLQDAGNPKAALRWSATARDFAREASDAQLTAYIEMRCSNIAGDAGRPDLSLGLARSALAGTDSLPPSLRAVLLRQQAFAHAMLGHQTASSHAIELALSNASLGPDEASDLTGYCTPSYIEMEAANCWLQLGKPSKAIGTLEHGLVDWQPQFRRDLGLGLARLAVAYAQDDDFDHALAIAEQATGIVNETGSARARRQLHAVERRATERGAQRQARRLRQTLAALA